MGYKITAIQQEDRPFRIHTFFTCKKMFWNHKLSELDPVTTNLHFARDKSPVHSYYLI